MRTTTALSILLLFIFTTSCKEIKPPAETKTAPVANETNETEVPTDDAAMPEVEFPEPGTETMPNPETPANTNTKPGKLTPVQIQSRNRKAAEKLKQDLKLQSRAGDLGFITPVVNDAGEYESLTLMGFKITDDAIQKISEMGSLTTELGLNQCEVTDEQIGQLANMKTLKSLKSIEFSSLPITGSSLGMLKVCDKLENLNLSGCPYLTIDQLPSLPSLTKLNLLDCRMVADKDIPKLASMKKLESLNLYQTSITPAGIAKLKESLPNCNISQ